MRDKIQLVKTYVESIGITKNHTGNKITTVIVRRSAG